MTNSSRASDSATGGLTRGGNTADNGMTIQGEYLMECFGPDGQLKWSERFDNLVTEQGKRAALDNALAGTTTINTRMIIFSGGTVSSTSVYATPLVTECTTLMLQNGASRLIPTWGGATNVAGNANVTKGTSAAVVYSVISAASATAINGAGIVLIANAVGNVANVADLATSGAVLYSAGYFTASKSVTTGDVLNVSYVTTLA